MKRKTCSAQASHLRSAEVIIILKKVLVCDTSLVNVVISVKAVCCVRSRFT